MAKKWVHVITVKSRGTLAFSFPIDMLRYDSCCPRTESDSVKIASTFMRIKDKSEEIDLVHIDEYKGWTPTYGRWDSFSYYVAKHEVLPV